MERPVSRGWEGTQRLEEARAGLLREGEQSRVPVEMQEAGRPEGLGVRVCYRVRPHAIEGAGVGPEVTIGHSDWRSKRKAGYG